MSHAAVQPNSLLCLNKAINYHYREAPNYPHSLQLAGSQESGTQDMPIMEKREGGKKKDTITWHTSASKSSS